MRFVLASQNQHKLREIRAMLEEFGIDLVSEADVGLDLDVEETGTTFEENSRQKAKAVMDQCHLPTIADDSGLEVDALDGAPGVYSHRFGNRDTDLERCCYLLEKLDGVPAPQRTACFVSVITCLFPDGREIVARGAVEGVILTEMRGENGFVRPAVLRSGKGKNVRPADGSGKERDLPSGPGTLQIPGRIPKVGVSC